MTIYWKPIDKLPKNMINKYENTIGIAVFGYNRPKELEKTLSRLSTFTNLSSYKTKVIVFIDGPKTK